MAQNPMTPPPNVVERNLALTADIMRYLMSQPHVLAALPDKFELVILPEDDPEIRLYNLELLDRYGGTGKPVVFARLKSHPGSDTHFLPPSLFVPVAA